MTTGEVPQEAGQKLNWLQKAQATATFTISLIAILGAFSLFANGLGVEYKRGQYSVLKHLYIPNSLLLWEYPITGWTYLVVPVLLIILFVSFLALVSAMVYVAGMVVNIHKQKKIAINALLCVFILLLTAMIHYNVYKQYVLIQTLLYAMLFGWVAGTTQAFLPKASFDKELWDNQKGHKRQSIFRQMAPNEKYHLHTTGRRIVMLGQVLLASCVFGVTIASLLGNAIQRVREDGSTSGQAIMAATPQPVQVIATVPLLIDRLQPNVSAIGSTQLLAYNGLYLLGHDEESYFLAKELDAACKPKHVYIAKADQVEVVPLPAPPLNEGCVPTQP